MQGMVVAWVAHNAAELPRHATGKVLNFEPRRTLEP